MTAFRAASRVLEPPGEPNQLSSAAPTMEPASTIPVRDAKNVLREAPETSVMFVGRILLPPRPRVSGSCGVSIEMHRFEGRSEIRERTPEGTRGLAAAPRIDGETIVHVAASV